jgi:hypothetical protein
VGLSDTSEGSLSLLRVPVLRERTTIGPKARQQVTRERRQISRIYAVAATITMMTAIVKEPNIREETAAIILRGTLLMFPVMSFHLLNRLHGAEGVFSSSRSHYIDQGSNRNANCCSHIPSSFSVCILVTYLFTRHSHDSCQITISVKSPTGHGRSSGRKVFCMNLRVCKETFESGRET